MAGMPAVKCCRYNAVGKEEDMSIQNWKPGAIKVAFPNAVLSPGCKKTISQVSKAISCPPIWMCPFSSGQETSRLMLWRWHELLVLGRMCGGAFVPL
jgi:hypothetical protein